jgi:serine/threonine protein kinase
MLSRLPEERISSIEAVAHPFFSDLAPFNYSDLPRNSATA